MTTKAVNAGFLILIGLNLVAVTVLAAIGKATPPILDDSLIGLIAGGLGITIPQLPTTTTVVGRAGDLGPPPRPVQQQVQQQDDAAT